jgi:hypothetical protein
MEVLQNGWFIVENPIGMDGLVEFHETLWEYGGFLKSG